MVEDTVLRSRTPDGKEEKDVEILAAVKPGENAREIGSDVQAGETILRKGDEISSVGGELGLLVSVGRREVQVYWRPVVGVLSTGDELVEHDDDKPLRPGQVRDSNRPTLLAAIRAAGFEAVDLGIARDQPGTLERTLRSALAMFSVIVTTGGVSMGELDLLKPTVERKLGGTIHFGRVAMKPGKPTTFATIPNKLPGSRGEDALLFALPGNPASALVTLQLFVLPSLRRTAGIQPAAPPQVPVVLDHDIRPDAQRTEFHRGIVNVGEDGRLHASSTGGQRSSRVGSLRGANALLVFPPGKEPVQKGSRVGAILIGGAPMLG
ncbi:MAG: hypothetical protein M1832_003582 [Thelocarpon impressellum]|nr:MAG: hypothetical protein M1832_003582 [Thelocarpon impressellum]